jgi:microcystin-dependent protein
VGQPFVGDIRMFGGNFAPANYAMCNGQTIPITQNETLFNLIGTTYGGDGVNTFNLPDLRGRVPVHMGNLLGNGFVQGEAAGLETVTVLTAQIPSHNHTAGCTNGNANQAGPGANIWATEPNGVTAFYTEAAPDGVMNGNLVGLTGGTQPHANIQPYLVINFIIALFGVFPSRN